MLQFLNADAGLLNTFILLAGIAAGFFAFRDARRRGIILIQDQTITALNQRLDAQDEEIKALKDKNTHLEYVIETISSAMKKKGIVISFDGEMVTFTDTSGTRESNVRPRSTRTTKSVKQEDKTP